MGRFHQDLTYNELELGEVPCPVCMEVDYFVAHLLESTHYEAGYHGYNEIGEGAHPRSDGTDVSEMRFRTHQEDPKRGALH
jgi:hypothetical protein